MSTRRTAMPSRTDAEPADAQQSDTATLDSLPTIRSLAELADLVCDRRDLYLRWSEGPEVDWAQTSRDALTGVALPGLSVSTLALEPWWEGRSTRVWAARRLFDYEHIRRRRRGEQRPWVLMGRECGRGPDNEPLVVDVQPVCWVDARVIQEARDVIDNLDQDWGPLDREAAPRPERAD
jgi:hypothetical protein